MNKFLIGLAATAAISTAVFAGGDLAVVAPIVEDVIVVDAAWTGGYVGAGITSAQTYLDGAELISDNWDSETGTGFNLIGGYQFLNTGDFALAAEGRYGQTFSGYDDSFEFRDLSGAILTDELVNYGLFAKGTVLFGDAGIYALAGYGQSEVDLYSTEASFDTTTLISGDGFAWGLGGEYKFTDAIVGFVDYVVYPTFAVTDISPDWNNDVITGGVSYRF